MTNTTRITGTREWAETNINCVLGCPHCCRYCYARANAVRFGQITRHDRWGRGYHRLSTGFRNRQREGLRWPHYGGRVMFPSSHDITPHFLVECLEVIDGLLDAGNRLLIVSKPHFQCIDALCHRYERRLQRSAITLRFSITARDDRILRYWEPGAPPYAERLACLKMAEAFRERYASLKESGMDADQMFTSLWRFAGGEHFVKPDQFAAVTAVLAYFFSSCDIFDNVPSNT